jgi:hypothetical protein
MLQRNFKLVQGVMRSGRNQITLRREENRWGKRRHQSWGDESTKEFQDSTEEPRDCQWGSWVTLTVKLAKRRVKKGEGVSSVQVYEPVKIG